MGIGNYFKQQLRDKINDADCLAITFDESTDTANDSPQLVAFIKGVNAKFEEFEEI